jgi:small subunit ribosomal protein S6
MAFYECVYIARQDLSAPQAEALNETFSKVVTDNGGSVTKTEYWGLRNLSFRIKKNRKGHYTLFNIDAPSAAVQEMERQMRLHEDVLRCLTVRVEELEAGPSAMTQSRGGDRGRPRRDRRDGFEGGYREGREGRESREPREPREAREGVE